MAGIIDPGSIGSTLGKFTYTGVGPPIFDRFGNIVSPPADSELLANIRTDQALRHQLYIEEQKAKEQKLLQKEAAAIAARELRNQKKLEKKQPGGGGKRYFAQKWQSARDFPGYGVKAAEWAKHQTTLAGALAASATGDIEAAGVRPGSYLDVRKQYYDPRTGQVVGGKTYYDRLKEGLSLGAKSRNGTKPQKSLIPEWTPELAVAGQGAGTEFGKFQDFRERAKARALQKLVAAQEKTQLHALEEKAPEPKRPTRKKSSLRR